MSKLLVVSDNHGDQQILTKILHQFGDQVDYRFHNGDSELSIDSPLVQQFNIVKGNMDFEDFPLENVVNIGDDVVYQTHGHLKNVNQSPLNLELTARSVSANIALFGHTHQLMCTMDGSLLLVNPGSISQPRGEFQMIGGTFCIVDVSTQKFIVDYYDRDLNLVPSLHFQFDR
ncbi:YfcE family phosphodiesterase [Lentilactobacillus curieae]|uniref:Phosphoesterase n=1 Tax=Lentilactobacillus curieae TaxID=1138822 RepID=A0A1S6QKN7_9LACO|nr:metallophosphoesterase [Lentilactobacillus curieae]AQW22192.1 YfcE family phosphodiesterase [Lentilactobacillus curieae]